jgi:hypothetical protein
MSTDRQLTLFSPKARRRAPAEVKPPTAPRADRAWLKSFISPELWTRIAEPPQIKHARRREARSA